MSIMDIALSGRRRRNPFHFLMLAWVLLTGLACATRKIPACDTPPPFLARIEASERLNLDSHGRPLPTVVRFLQLSDTARLEGVSFQRLWGAPEAVLEKDLLESTEFVIAPGQTLERWIQRDPKTQYVVAMGLFRQHLGQAWRTTTRLEPVPPHQCTEQPAGEHAALGFRDTQIRLKLQGYQVDVPRHSPGRTP
jgi:type VI secretion system protein VasD